MKKGTLKLALGLAAGLFTLAVLARQSGFVTLWEGLGASFTTAVAEDAIPPNDNCADAIPLTVQLNACPDIEADPVQGTTFEASNTSLRPRPSCHGFVLFPPNAFGATILDVWYTYEQVAGLEYTVRVNGAANMDAVVALYDDCENIVDFDCEDDQGPDGTEVIVYTATYTGTVLVRVYDWSLDLPIGGDFQIQVRQTPVPPANDLCSGIVPAVAVGASVDGTNIAATDDPAFDPFCSGFDNENAVFYRTSVIQTGNGENNVGFSTDFANTDFDTQIGIYSGTCGAPVCVDGNDDTNTSLNSFQEVTTTSTQNYIVAIGRFPGEPRGCFTYSPIQLPSITNIAAGAAGVPCDVPSNTYSQNVEVTYTGAFAGSSLVIEIDGVPQTFAVTSSPQTVTLTVPANGATVDLTASLTGGTVPADLLDDDDNPLANFAALSEVEVPAVFVARLPCEPCLPTCEDIIVNLTGGQCDAIVNYENFNNVVLTGNCFGSVPGNTPVSADDFNGQFAPASWEYAVSPFGDASVDASGAPASISLTGNDNTSDDPPVGSGTFEIEQSNLAVTIPTFLDVNDNGIQDPNETPLIGNVTVSFDWAYNTADPFGSTYDPFGYAIGAPPPNSLPFPSASSGTYVQLTTNGLSTPQGGTVTVSVAPGETFRFVQYGDFFGTATTTISNFSVSGVIGSVGAALVEYDPASGSSFGIGTTEVEVSVTVNGVTNRCTFDVIVNPVANPVTSLVCNDLTNISLDESCTLVLTADMVLEGGPYKCYDTYIVQVDRSLPLGNGPWVTGTLTAADVHRVLAVRVVDDVNGDGIAQINENSCWGNINIEDKLPPVIDCGPCSSPLASIGVDGTLGLDLTYDLATANTTNGQCVIDATNVFYSEVSFTVVEAGTYTIVTDATFDSYAFLYAGFDPEDACAGLLEENDDSGPGLNSQIVAFLTPGTYTVVLTSFDFLGDYTVNVFAPIGGGGLVAEDCLYDCADLNDILADFTSNDGPVDVAPATAVDGCEGAITQIVSNPNAPGRHLSKKDVVFTDPNNAACGFTRIERTWTAKDSWGNSSQCTQYIYLRPFTHDDIDFPDDITIDCAGCGDAPGVRPCDLGSGYNVPYAGIYPLIANPQNILVVGCATSGGVCNLGASYTDVRINVCAGTFKILRTWTVLDWCTNTTWTHEQLIKVVDKYGPAIACPADMTVSTNPSQCCATVDLPNVIVEDNCSPTATISAMIQVYDQYLPEQVIATYTLDKFTNPGQFKLETFQGNNFWDCDTLGNYGITPCLPIGHHLVTYMAEDVCGNVSSCTFWLTVVDDVPPVATCTEFTTVAIGTDDPTDCYAPTGDCKFGGVTWVPASAFNQGSYDNCNDIAFTVRRMKADTGYSDCIEGLKFVEGCDNWRVEGCGELDYTENNGFNDEYDIATAENDSIKFYCCEVGTTQRIILRVYQLDINGNWAYYTDENGNPLLEAETGCIQYIYNECMIDVEVQDKIKPVCLPPAHVSVACENFEPSLWAYGYPSAYDNCCLDETPPTSAAPGGVTNIPAGTTAIPGVCGMTQKTYYSGFPGAAFDTTCNKGTIIRRFTAWDCYGFSSSCTQRIIVNYNEDYTIVFPADDTENCVGTPDFGYPQITNDEGCELIGISYNDVYFTVVPDACYKIERTWTVINWCTYVPDDPCYDHQRQYGRTVRVWGGQPAAGVPAPPGGWNDPRPQGMGWVSRNCVTYKQIIKVIDQTPPTITCAPIDTCDYSSNFDTDGLRYWNDGDLWWDNGTQSHNLCETDKTLLSVSAEDFCDSISPVGGLRFRYLLFLDTDADGIMETVISSADANTTRPGGLYGRVRYNNYQNQNYGGGGASSVRRFDLSSNPYAFNIEQTLTGARVIWRTAGGSVQNPNLPHGRHKIKWIAEDGCGNEAVCEEVFTIRDCKAPTVACADVNINLMYGGMATLWTSDFFLYAEDNCTPADILKVAVIRADDTDYDHVSFPAGSPQSIVVTCDDQGTNVPVEVWVIDAAGRADFCTAYVNVQANLVGCNTPATATVAGALTSGTQGVEQANVELNGTPNVNMTFPTGDNGAFNFANVPMGANITVTPTKDDNPLNGVTTYDLVLVSKHILGLEPLNTPYKMIAADANRSGSITTFDIVEFRKLILGIYNELPNNTSWRFVDKSYSFPNPSNPFQSAIPENVSIGSLSADMMVNNFEGVKIGDVNGTAIANSLQSVEDRTAATMLFDVQDRTVKAGEVFTVNFKGAEKVQGYQFTMNFNGLEVQDITPGENMKLDNFGVFADAITTSVDGEANEFAVTFRATKAGQISNMLGVSSRITKAEGYSLTNDRLDVAFRFNGAAGSVISGVGFELYQNQPNPFVNKTFIGFHLPEAANATLRIFDETGRMVFTQNGEFAKGYNTISVDRALLNTTGLLYYTLETATDSATKKMIQSK